MSDNHSNPTEPAGQSGIQRPKTYTHLLPLEAPTPARAFAAEAHSAGLDVKTNRWSSPTYPYWFITGGDGEHFVTATVYDDGISAFTLGTSSDDDNYVSVNEVRSFLQRLIAERSAPNRPVWLETRSDGSVVDINGQAVSA